MDWLKFCKDYFGWGIATSESLKIYVVKNKITSQQYKEITSVDYMVTVTQ